MRLMPSSSHQQVAEMLRAEIFSGQLLPGSFLDEPVLCERLAISRTLLREALKVLSAAGWLRHEPRRGGFVYQASEQDLEEIFPVIALLEGRCAFEAARNVSDVDLSTPNSLQAQLKAYAKVQRVNDYYATNLNRHEAIITLANPRWLAQAIADLYKILNWSRFQPLCAPGRLAQSLSERSAIYAALRVRDSVGVEAAMRPHRMHQRVALRKVSLIQESRLLT
jgi:DNA-binding GntR family transcriptional regulator